MNNNDKFNLLHRLLSKVLEKPVTGNKRFCIPTSNKSETWMSSYNINLDGIPTDIIKTEKGYQQVYDYIVDWVYY